MRVLVTAFKPFNNSENNYSEEVLKYIENVDKKVLDVVYNKCYEILEKSHDLNQYDLIISLGEARMRKEITLEVQAKNISSCSLPDNENNLKKDEVIINTSEEILYTKVNISDIDKIIKLSNDAGKFVCNNLYYHLLYNYPEKSLFIHIPECNNSIEEYLKNSKIINCIINKLSNTI